MICPYDTHGVGPSQSIALPTLTAYLPPLKQTCLDQDYGYLLDTNQTKKFELVRIIGDSVVIHFRINLKDNQNGTCTGVWDLTFTALNESGNQMNPFPITALSLSGLLKGWNISLRQEK
jgi:hypothetical protein